MTTETQIDQDTLMAKAENAFGIFGSFITAANIYLGDELGLYAAMKNAGP